MTKYLHSGDFSGFNALIIFVYSLLRMAAKKIKLQVLSFVSLYMLAILLQAGALIVFYISVKLYVDPNAYDLSKIEQWIPLSLLTNVEILLLSTTPALILLLSSSKLLGYCRVSLSGIALTLKERVSNEFIGNSLIYTGSDINDDTFYKQIDGLFGSVRALFLNSFVFFQAIASVIALSFMEPILSLIYITMLVVFLYLLTTIKPIKYEENSKNQLDEVEDIVDEDLGLNSKSFARLERLRIFGRNYSNIGLFVFVLAGVVLSLDFMITIEEFSVVLILLRFSMQIYTPIAVISASCVPYKKNIITMHNILKLSFMIKGGGRLLNGGSAGKLYVFVSKNFLNRSELLEIYREKDNPNGLSVYFDKERESRAVNIVTTRLKLSERVPGKLSKEILKKIGEFESNDKLLFCI